MLKYYPGLRDILPDAKLNNIFLQILLQDKYNNGVLTVIIIPRVSFCSDIYPGLRDILPSVG
jgi:hypothetical protein